MTNYTAPPDQTGLVLQSFDTLNVFGGGTATGTILNENSVVNVNPGGKGLFTIVNGGVLNILDIGIGTTINSGNENVAGNGATVTNTTINGGSELLNAGTTAIGTIINAGGGQQVLGMAIGTASVILVVTISLNGGRRVYPEPLKTRLSMAVSKPFPRVAPLTGSFS